MRAALQRLRERKIAQWALTYLAASWLLLQVLDLLAGVFGWAPEILRAAVTMLAGGLLAVLLLAWYHGETGPQKVSSVEVLLLVGVLVLAGSAVAFIGNAETSTSGTTPPPEEDTAGSSPGERASIAVLPCTDLSPNRDQEYFSHGLTDELLTRLAQVQGLRVPARTSVFVFAGAETPVQDVARQLQVEHVLECGVRRSGSRLRINAHLTDAATGFQVWAQTYDRELTDVLILQDEITGAILSALGERLPGGGALQVSGSVSSRTVDPAVYNLYLRGRHRWAVDDQQNLSSARDLFEAATRLDSSYAPAWAGIADTYARLADIGALPHTEASPLGIAAAQRALHLDPGLAEAHTALAHLLMHQWQWQAAEQSFRDALKLYPNYATLRLWYAVHLQVTGRPAEAADHARKAVLLDPLGFSTQVTGANVLGFTGHFEEAMAAMATALRLRPERENGLIVGTGLILLEAGRYDEAIEVLARFQLPATRAMIARALALKGDVAAAQDSLAVIVAELPPQRASFSLALAYASIPDPEAALDYLESLVTPKASSLVFVRSPGFRSLEHHPRYQRLLRTMGLTEGLRFD